MRLSRFRLFWLYSISSVIALVAACLLARYYFALNDEQLFLFGVFLYTAYTLGETTPFVGIQFCNLAPNQLFSFILLAGTVTIITEYALCRTNLIPMPIKTPYLVVSVGGFFFLGVIFSLYRIIQEIAHIDKKSKREVLRQYLTQE